MEAQQKLPNNALLFLYEEVQKRPRHVGALVACGLLIWLALASGHAPFTTALIAMAWLVGTVIGGYFRTIAKYLLPKYTKNLPGTKYWAFVLIGSWVSSIFMAMILDGPGGVLAMAELLVLPTCVLYFFSKIGCHKFGCCGWPEKYNQLEKVLPLQTLEASLSLVLGLILAVLIIGKTTPLLIAIIFVTFHGILRIMSRICRRQPILKIIFMPDAGIIAGTGFLLWITYV